MFDSVVAYCPQCGGTVEFQSKAMLDPALEVYYLDEVPMEIALDIDGETETCIECGTGITLKIPSNMSKYTPMVLQKETY